MNKNKKKTAFEIKLDELERATKEAYHRHNWGAILAYRQKRREVIEMYEEAKNVK